MDWDELFQKTYDSDYPPDSRFESNLENELFEKEGEIIWRQLQKELDGIYLVEYKDKTQ